MPPSPPTCKIQHFQYKIEHFQYKIQTFQYKINNFTVRRREVQHLSCDGHDERERDLALRVYLLLSLMLLSFIIITAIVIISNVYLPDPQSKSGSLNVKSIISYCNVQALSSARSFSPSD